MRFLGRSVIGLAVAGILALGLAGVASAAVTNVYWARGSANKTYATPRTSFTLIMHAASPTSGGGTSLYQLQYQSDGNLVVDHYSFTKNDDLTITPVWQSGTYGKGATAFVRQGDGNLVIYKGSTPLWETCTNVNASKFALSLNGSTGKLAVWYWGGNAYDEDWLEIGGESDALYC